MSLFLHHSLCDLNKAGQLASSADPSSKAGEQRGGDYFHRIQTGYNKDNSPAYRYFHTKEEWDSYNKKKSKASSGSEGGAEDGAERLKAKLEKERGKTSGRNQPEKNPGSLFIKDSKASVKKSVNLYFRGK